jgi:hypothetical protein
MSRLIWSPSALLDVQRFHRFLAPKNPDAAKGENYQEQENSQTPESLPTSPKR